MKSAFLVTGWRQHHSKSALGARSSAERGTSADKRTYTTYRTYQRSRKAPLPAPRSPFRVPRSALRTCRPAFTLVEMLVAITLVLLMLLLFAEIFQMASGSISTQRGIAENDQRARAVVTLLRGDFDKRSFRNVVPFFTHEPYDQPTTPFSNRLGYLYISLNDLNDATDNVLQFTIRSTIRTANGDDTPYFGKAALLSNDANGNGSVLDEYLANPNQPDADDAQITPDDTASSTAAEVSYFLRGGRLYRRVLLIREPLPLAGGTPQPEKVAPPPIPPATPNFFLPSNALYPVPAPPANTTGNFWNDFDFSAYNDTLAANTGAKFLGISDLTNEGAEPSFVLGKPRFRFGHSAVTGLPREFSNNTPTAVFLGRFTHEETSHPDFDYPQFPSALWPNGDPMDDTANAVTINPLDPSGVVAEFEGGPRRGEDLLLSNVHAFDIEVWDDRLTTFVGIGHSDLNAAGEEGDYHSLRRINSAYGPRPPGGLNNVFDTWHPQIDLDGDGIADQPPFRPMIYYPPSPPYPAGFPSPTHPHWAAGNYALGDVVFPLTEDANGNGQLDAGEDGTNGFPADGLLNGKFGYAFHYRCVEAGTSSTQPNWSTTPGQITSSPAPDTSKWVAVYNLRPLRAIQITIRFLHVSTGQMRQVTLVHSLVD